MSKAAAVETSFQTAYQQLNACQKKAVDTIEGPVMVIAGPGTGKTQILTLRIANILKKTDTRPEQILAITFTDAGTKAMRTRLQSLIGEAAFDVRIATFHAFAEGLISQYPEAYPKVIGGRAAADIERIQIIENILTDTTFKAVRPGGDPGYYVQPLLRAIQSLKQENVSPQRFQTAVAEQEAALLEIDRYHKKGAHKGKERGEYKEAVKKLERNRELQVVYVRYEQLLRDQKLYDYDDMILETVTALEKDEDMLRDLQEQYQYVLADEHQDVNGAQNKILELLTNFHDQPNIFVVGDEKQAIYRFQGASLENFLYFEEVFTEATLISLTDNYRSGQSILDASQAIIDTEDKQLQALRTPLTAAAVTEAKMLRANFAHTAIEQDWIVDEVQESIAAGVDAAEIAIIVRTNKEVQEYATLLRKRGIAAAPTADSDILEHPLLRTVETLIAGVTTDFSDLVLAELLHAPYWAITTEDLAIVFAAKTYQRGLREIISSTKQLDELQIAKDSKLRVVAPLLKGIRDRSVTTPPHRLLEMLLVESRLVSHVLSTDPEEGVRVLRRLYDEVEGMVERNEVVDLAGVLRRFQLHRQYNVSLPAPYVSYGASAVQVTTAHKAKGLEYEVVYIPSLSDKTWGGKRQRELFSLPILTYTSAASDAVEEDERRLFYVAMTRAKTKLVLTNAEMGVTGKELLSSRFVSELPGDLIEEIDTSTYMADFDPVQSMAGVLPKTAATSILRDVLEARGLSPTALNNYLKSPWEYFFKNALRVPQVKTLELQYGTAIHAVLQELIHHQPDASLETWLTKMPQLLSTELRRAALSEEEYTRLHERGCAALVAYLPHLRRQVKEAAKTEYQLEAMLATGIDELPTVRITGNLDRIDTHEGAYVRVVDYKTGKLKSRNVIEGNTATSNGDYKRQLVFYALLLSLQAEATHRTRTGVLSFVEPDSNGNVREESFEITDEEIAALKAEIIEMVRAVVKGEALTKACDPEISDYCHLATTWIE